MLPYNLSSLGSICQGLASSAIHLGLVCYSISCHALAVSAEAWHSVLYLVTPWQYLPRLRILFYNMFESISYHALAVFVEAWHAFLSCHSLAVSAKAWQYLPRLGILFYILSCLGSICQGLACYCNILSRLGSICLGLACFSILSCLGSICRGLAFSSISYHALAVLAKGPTSKNPSYKSSSWNLKNNPVLQKPRMTIIEATKCNKHNVAREKLLLLSK